MLDHQYIADSRFSRVATLRRHGFTIVDIVLTVLIIGIMAAAAAPRIADSMVLSRVRGAALVVASDLEHARQHAKVTGISQTVTFTPASDLYELNGLSDLDRSSEAYAVELAAEPYEVSLASASFGSDGTALTVTFNQFGRPDYGGSVVVAVGSTQRTIVVDAASGRASIQP